MSGSVTAAPHLPVCLSLGSLTEPVLEEDNGRFSWTADSEGNRIELWEARLPS